LEDHGNFAFDILDHSTTVWICASARFIIGLPFGLIHARLFFGGDALFAFQRRDNGGGQNSHQSQADQQLGDARHLRVNLWRRRLEVLGGREKRFVIDQKNF